MANLNIATFPRITASALASRLLSASSPPKDLTIIDVRDDDYIGGHIRHSEHVPSSSLDYRTPLLARNLADKKMVVFHCMLCQQRGPSAALRYARERERLLGPEKGKCLTDGDKESEVGAESGQKVCFLEKGFEGWRQMFGEDERLTEGYNKLLWDEGLD